MESIITNPPNFCSLCLPLRFRGYSRLTWTGIKVRVVKANDISKGDKPCACVRSMRSSAKTSLSNLSLSLSFSTHLPFSRP